MQIRLRRTRDGHKFRLLNVVDEFSRERLAIRVGRQLRAADVIDVLSDLNILRGVPGHVRSDNRPEFAANAVKSWITGVGAKTAFIEPGSPWENGYVESFNGKLRDELLPSSCPASPPSKRATSSSPDDASLRGRMRLALRLAVQRSSLDQTRSRLPSME